MSLVLKSYIKHVLNESSLSQENEGSVVWSALNNWLSFQKDFTDEEASLIIENLDKNYNLVSFGEYCATLNKKPKIYRGIAGIKKEELEEIIGEKVTSNSFIKKLNINFNNKQGRLFDSWTSKKSWAKKFALRRFNIKTTQMILDDSIDKLRRLGNKDADLHFRLKDAREKIHKAVGDEIWNIPAERVVKAKEDTRAIISNEFGKSFKSYEEANNFLTNLSRQTSLNLDQIINEEYYDNSIISDYFDIILEGTIKSDNNPPNLFVDESFLRNGEKLKGVKAQGEVIVFGQVNVTKVQCFYTSFGNRTMNISVAY